MINTSTSIEETIPKNKRRSTLWSFLLLFFIIATTISIAFFLVLYFLNQTPSEFEEATIVTIEPGTSVRAITEKLEEARVVRSGSVLYFAIMFFYEPTDVKASTYIFDSRLTTLQVARKLAVGDFDTDLLRFTHFEGERASDIAKHAKEVLIDFDEDAFLAKAVPLEGTLYPDTYFIPKNYTADELVTLMTKTFTEETSSLQSAIENSSLSAVEIIILASILEREANSTTSMSIVSGILQRRLIEGMPLQADASIEYILEKPLKDLTPDDLRIDSPYNTYTNKGLPPTPIGNPGIDAITAVLHPTETSYVYYLTDNDGEFHYATSYAEHLINIERYLR